MGSWEPPETPSCPLQGRRGLGEPRPTDTPWCLVLRREKRMLPSTKAPSRAWSHEDGRLNPANQHRVGSLSPSQSFSAGADVSPLHQPWRYGDPPLRTTKPSRCRGASRGSCRRCREISAQFLAKQTGTWFPRCHGQTGRDLH